MPATLEALCLLGWMDEQEAISFLKNQCRFDSPLTDQQAAAMWTPYKQRVDNLPERNVHLPACLPIPAPQRRLANDFKARFRDPEIVDVICLNPMDLVCYQLLVVSDKADEHTRSRLDWARKFIVIDRPGSQLPIRMERGTLKVTLPHGEHMIALQQDGAFRIQQGAGFVSVVQIGPRMILKAGYHRSFAFSRSMMNAPDANDKFALVVLTRTLPPQLSPDFPNQGLRTVVLGPRPPLLSDFFDLDLVTTVRLRKKRYEAHICITQIDEP